MSERPPSNRVERRPEATPTNTDNYNVGTPRPSGGEERATVAARLAAHAAAGHGSHHDTGGVMNSAPVKVGKGVFGFIFDLLWQGIKSLPAQWTGGGGGGGSKKSGGHGDSHGGGGHH
jgi:hypothetical protein